MDVAVLDVCDSNLQLWHGEHHLRSPGYALLEGEQYLFGRPARAKARLEPRNINTRYWWQLSTELLQPALGPARHSGDLVHAHLQQLHREAEKPGELLLAVSGSLQRDQLALLLGIVQQCPFDAVGLVHRSVALASLYAGAGRLHHLEVQLHQALLTELEESGDQITLARSIPLPGCGLLQLQERIVEIIAAAFIRQTRFDPRRKAATEQQLYDALPDALRQLRRDTEHNLEINGYRARVTRDELKAAGQRLFESAGQSIGKPESGSRIMVDPLVALLPGLGQHFPQMQALQHDDLHSSLIQHQVQLVQRGGALSFVTTLPCLQQRVTPRMLEPAPTCSPEPATHLLVGSQATPLVEDGTDIGGGWQLFKSGDGWQLRGSGEAPLVNGATYTAGSALGAGDQLATDSGHEYQLIAVQK